MNKEQFECKSCKKEINDHVNITRFISNLDNYFKSNDLDGASKYLTYWENEARNLHDINGLLTILNEEIGFSRRTKNEELAIKAVNEAKELLKQGEYINSPSGAVIIINIATTLNCFGNPKEGVELYALADKIYKEYHLEKTYEYAALLNNKSTALGNLERYDEAIECVNQAMDILKEEGKHDGEIAVSLINLAHIIYNKDDTAFNEVEATLDKAWEYINSPRQPHDANYAFILSKCAPSLRYFKREMEADAIEEVAKEIYGANN